VRDEVLQAVERIPGVLEVSEARIRKSGAEVFADVVLKVDRALVLEQAHEITSQAEATVRAILPGVDMVFNVIPADVTDEGYFTKVRSLASRRGLGAHSLRIYNIAGSQTLELHLEVGEGLSLADAHAVADLFEADVTRAFPEIKRVITHLEPGGEKTLHTASMTRETVSADQFRVLQALEEYCERSGEQFEPFDLTTHRVGRELMVSFRCRLDPDMALTEAHQWTEQVERALRKKIPSIGRVVIHVEPWRRII
jgi:divalent metal cation (Fe/Co/Zn/Cd) transporter